MQRPLHEQYSHLLKQYMDNAKFNDTAEIILSSIERFSQQELKNLKGKLTYDKQVKMPDAFKKPYQDLCKLGYVNLALKEPYGLNAPWVLHYMAWEILSSHHISLSTCPMLTFGVIRTLLTFPCSAKQYIPKLVKGECSATMCLTEPQCGSDLSLIQTKALKNNDHYLITGHKTWITYGDHDLSDNIVHLVLAKTKSNHLSLFLVPKLIGGKDNQVFCHGIVDTMGQEQTPTCMMEFSGSKGYLVGKVDEGMKTIFTMMNTARIGVAVQALGLAEKAFQKALTFSQIRRSIVVNQKRIPIAKLPSVHQSLMIIYTTQYAMRLLIAYTSFHIDQGNDDIVSLLTPIVKGFITEKCVENISKSMQVMGGLGYLTIGQCEKYYRDCRVTTIYEGTTAIQALDLLLRKVLKDQGKTLKKLLMFLGEDSMYQDLWMIHQKMEKMDQSLLTLIANDYLNYLSSIVLLRLVDKDAYLTDDEKIAFNQHMLSHMEMYKYAIMRSRVKAGLK